VTNDAVPTMKLSEVTKACGVSVEVLRQLISDGLLAGAVRNPNGHTYLRADAVPTWQHVVELLEVRLLHHARRAKAAHDRVQVELEAVGNDLAEAIDHPLEPLGDELVAFRYYGQGHGKSVLSLALDRLQGHLWSLETYSEALRATRRAV
jgi:DNA-binding transcriptional MerR regulator